MSKPFISSIHRNSGGSEVKVLAMPRGTAPAARGKGCISNHGLIRGCWVIGRGDPSAVIKLSSPIVNVIRGLWVDTTSE